MTVAFELLRFEAAPASAAAALVELDGVFAGPPPARVRLLVEQPDARLEVPALAADGADPWTATFAVPLALLQTAEFALVVGRDLVGLPAPETSGAAGDDRFVKLARQANALRHRLEESVAANAAREEISAGLVAERDTLRAELEAETTRADAAEQTAQAARDQRDSATATAEAVRGELAEAREEVRAAEARATEAERERAALRARAEAAERAVADARASTDDEHEAEVARLRTDLVQARARIEALERDLRHQHDTVRRGHEVVEDDEPTTTLNGAAPDPEPEAEATRAMPITQTRVTKVVRLDDGEGADVDDDRERRIVRRIEGLTIDTGDVLEPAAVGARFIEPSETPAPLLTSARILVGVALLVFVVVFVAILLGAGVV